MQLSDDPRVGTLLAGYRLEALLGRGGVSVVYLAEDVRRNRQVALRLLNPELTSDERFRERFLREAQLAASLDNTNILPLYEAGEAQGQLYVATPSVEGSDLASLLAGEGRLEPERTLLLVTQLAEALDAARFSRGLVHGSLKPSEVLLASTPSGERVVLCGFGLRQELPPGATVADAPKQFDSIDYLAPEQIEGKSVSPRSDVYALGCLLFQCLTGESPFKGDSPEALLEAHLHEQPPSATQSRPGLPAGIDRVIGTALAKWPEERYSTCGELAAAAQAVLAPGKEPFQPAPKDDHLSPVALLPRPERAPGDEMPPSGVTDGSSVDAPDSLAQRLWKHGAKPIAAVGLVVLLAALVAGALWLTGSDTGDVSSASPASPAEAETTSQVLVEEGQGAAEAPPQAEAPAEPTAVSEPPAKPADDGPPGLIASLGPSSLVRLDATTGEILARVAIPSASQIDSDGSSIWVLGGGGLSGMLLVRVDVARNAVTDIFDAGVAAGNTGPSSFAAAGGSAWLSDYDSGRIYRFAPGEPAAELVEFDAESPELYWPVAAAGSLWFASPTGALRVDPDTERVLARFGGVGSVVVAAKGFLWAERNQPGSDATYLVHVDTETHTTVPVGVAEGPNLDFSVAHGALWASSHNGTIARLDPMTGEARERIRVWPAPGALAADLGVWVPVAAGANSVWAANQLDGAVARYDIATGRIDTIDLGGTPNDLVFADGSIWVAVDELAGSANELTRAEYFAKADAICTAATDRFAAELSEGSTSLEYVAAWNEAAARISEETLAELRALLAPKADRPHLNEFYSLLEQQTDVLRKAAAAAAAGDRARAEALGWKRVHLTHQKDALEPDLQGCPVNLPA